MEIRYLISPSMQTILYILFSLATLSILTLVTYPLFSYLRGIVRPAPVCADPGFCPAVSILIACYNEERYIHQKVSELLNEIALQPDSELLIISTGSDDQTNEILRSLEQLKQVHIFYAERISKIEALNRLVPLSKNEILVFSDCRQLLKPGSVSALVSWLKDEQIGTVSCTMMDTETHPSFFRKLYLQLALWDMRYGSSLNLYGALYAQRRSVFRPIPEHLLFDDFFVAVSTLSQQKRLVQSKEAVLYDIPFNTYYNQERMQRLARGLLLFLFTEKKRLKKVPLSIRLRIYWYKYLKLFLPISGIISIVCSYFLFTPFLNKTMLLLGCLILLVLFTFSATRQHLLLVLRMNYYFARALWGYLFLNQRSKYWEQLTIKRRVFHPDQEEM